MSDRPAAAAAAFDPADFAALGGLNLRARRVVEGFLNGVHASPFHGPSVEFADYRPYQPGDDLRHLDWRLYARTDRLYSKRYVEETNARAWLVVDTSGSMAYRGRRAWGSKLEAARTLAAALGWLLLGQGDAVGLVAPDRSGAGTPAPADLRPSAARTHLGRLLGALEGLPAAGEGGLAELLERTARLARRRGLVFLVGDLLEPVAALRVPLQRLRFAGHEVRVLRVHDPDEIDFPFPPGAVLEDLESGVRRSVESAATVELYLRRFAVHRAEHEELLHELEIPHAEARTDRDPALALLELLAARRRAA